MNIRTDQLDQPDIAAPLPRGVGPILYMQGLRDGRVQLNVLIARPSPEPEPLLRTEEGPVAAQAGAECDGLRTYHYALSLRMAPDAWYAVDGVRYEVNTAFEGDLRIAFVSCNGQEHGDRRRPRDERNALWRRLVRQHEEQPFHLLLHGGDQMYADELLDSHAYVRQWADGADVAAACHDRRVMEDIVGVLRRGFFRRYVEVFGQPEISRLMACVPSLAMWDDHDICDGWGSMRVARLDAPIGRELFSLAREHFLLFQLGAAPEEVPVICPDRTGTSLSWHVRLPQLHLIAPDLRSERRPNRVMGKCGWQALEAALAAVDDGRVLLLSSVPALGPRLSWVEAVMHLTPKMEKYEDDLRDQWQSRAHRAEWRAFLERLAKVHRKPNTPVTLLSGEIHLATRGTFDVPPAPVHQLVASGIVHPAPSAAYARALGGLARFGDAPLPGHAIRMHPLPGKKAVYTAQRNYLILERRDREWRTWWELENDGATPAMNI